MKKVLVFLALIVVLFSALAFVNHYSAKQAAEGNPYGKEKLHPATVKQLKDPNYSNQILPEELDQIIANKEDAFIYFYQSHCEHCQATSPVVVPLAKELGIDLKLFNLAEFEDGWNKYQIANGVPFITYYKDGVRVENPQPLIGSILPGNEERFTNWVQQMKDLE